MPNNNNTDKTERVIDVEEKIVKYKLEKRIEFENLRHKHIMEEIDAMKKANVKKFERGDKDVVGKAIKNVKRNVNAKKKKKTEEKKAPIVRRRTKRRRIKR